MKFLRWLGFAVVALAIAFSGLYYAMAERVEVVVLHSRGPDGEHETRLWVTDDAGYAWLRTGAENASWLPRVRANPDVELERGGATQAFRAVVVEDPETVARANQRTLEKYGWSEQLLRRMGGDPARNVAIRLEAR